VTGSIPKPVLSSDTPLPDSDTPRPAPGLPTRTEPSEPEPELIVVEPRTSFSLGDTQELWRYRELFYYLILRELKLRYKQTILGVGWSLFQPIATVLVFVVFIGYMGKTANNIPNYELYVLLGVIPWTFFSSAMANAGNSLLANERLVTKVYFPRLLLPLSNVGSSFVDFLIACGLIAITMLYIGVAPAWTIVFAPLVLTLLFLTATGFGVLLSALIVAQRDFRYLLTFGTQLWMFATPCIYLGPDVVGPTAKMILPLNPLYGLIYNLRNLVLGGPMDYFAWYSLAISGTVGLCVLFLGLFYFRRVERTFADTI
jgi:lipopolysaccharide transport system permease protein